MNSLDLYGKELIAIDGSKFKAVNSKDRNFNETKLKERMERLNARKEEYMRQIDEADAHKNAVASEKSADEIKKIITELESRKATYQSYQDELTQDGQTQKSLTDPDSRRMMSNGRADICYNVQTAVDAKNKLIAEFDVTNQPFDTNQLANMAALTSQTLEKTDLFVVADVGYDGASDIAKCLADGFTPHVAGTDFDICLEADEPRNDEITSQTNGRGVYLSERNIALCPMGRVLYPGGYKNRNKRALFYNSKACAACSCKCTVERYKKFEIAMNKSDFTKVYNDENLYVRQIRVKADKKIVGMRKAIVEHPFGTIKRTMDAGYLLTKRFKNVRGEFSLAFLAHNLKRAINILGAKRIIEAVKA